MPAPLLPLTTLASPAALPPTAKLPLPYWLLLVIRMPVLLGSAAAPVASTPIQLP